MQGEVRGKFEEKKINSDEFLKEFYPTEINTAQYREVVQRELNKIYKYLEEKFAIESLMNNLGKIKLEDFERISAESLTFTGTVSKNLTTLNNLTEVSSSIDKIIEELNTISNNLAVSKEDQKCLKEIKQQLINFSKRFINRKNSIDLENQIIAVFQSALTDFKTTYSKSISDSQKKLSAYCEGIKRVEENIVDLVCRNRKNNKPIINFEPIDVSVKTNKVYNYEFNSRIQILKIDTDYIWQLFDRVLKKDTRTNILDMTQEELSGALLRYDGLVSEALSELRRNISSLVEEDFKPRYTITEAGKDKTEELSAGFNAQIYFTLLSYATDKDGIYIIDQPEDNISQKAIREYLLDRFKIMGERRQVIIVTHNPQFIVNLEVDNVVYLGKNDDGTFIVQSGALEYSDENYSILDIISSHIEGGLETLQRRWKRYEKNSKISSY